MPSDTTTSPWGKQPPADPNPIGSQRPRRRWWWLIIAGLLGLVLIATAVIAQLLPGSADGPPVLGVTTVEISGNAFKPPVIQVEQGTTVTWSFADDGTIHNVSGDGWGSDPQLDGEFTHTFTAVGRYRYRCTLHRRMEGRVDIVATGPESGS